MRTPSPPFGAAAVALEFVPMKLPCTTVWPTDTDNPIPVLPDITLPLPATVPPMIAPLEFTRIPIP